MSGIKCPLCFSDKLENIESKYQQCLICQGIFMLPDFRLNAQAEQMRYETHQNDINNPGDRKFVSPITDAVIREYTTQHKGLDFGAGTGPVICAVLQEHQYQIVPYDPFFHPNEVVLGEKYDFIACCEVMEHFFRPHEEFKRLFAMLKAGGTLYCMTHLLDKNIQFEKWYYRNDPTHVFFYNSETIAHIAYLFDIKYFTIENRLICFKK